VGGTTRALPALFTVIATQNPLEHEGTYPLPEAQLDRFLLKLHVSYPSPDEELEVLRRDQESRRNNAPRAELTPKVSLDEVLSARHEVDTVYLDEMLQRYIVALVNASRDPTPWAPELAGYLTRGASPRASLALARSARALAYLRDRDFVEPGDIMAMAEPVLNHRIGLSFAARADGLSPSSLVARLTQAVPVP
jgi:MoxR-like ATPase